MLDNLLNRIKRKWVKMRLEPIRVYCLHHVSAEYDPLTMWECDWIQLDEFKQKVLQMREEGVEFISLREAHEKLRCDWLRCKRYAVLTADDGYKSILNILPWLSEQQIPITLFVNTKYLDGKSWSEINEEQARRAKPNVNMEKEVCPILYLSKQELLHVAAMTNVTIGMHGYEHLDATQQTIEEFEDNVMKCQTALKEVPHTIPYFAYTFGHHNKVLDEIVKGIGLIPVLVEGTKNYSNVNYIDRELMDK